MSQNIFVTQLFCIEKLHKMCHAAYLYNFFTKCFVVCHLMQSELISEYLIVSNPKLNPRQN